MTIDEYKRYMKIICITVAVTCITFSVGAVGYAVYDFIANYGK